MDNKILVVGKGELGTALSRVLGKIKGNKVTLWGKSPELPEADVVFMAVPTNAVVDVARKVNNTQDRNTIIVVLSKGLGKEGKTPWELVSEIWQGRKALISGPMIAEELVSDKTGLGLVAGSSVRSINQVIGLFENSNLHLQKFEDLIGLSWAGPLKNMYAIGLGMADGENKGMNYKGWYVQQAVKEMAVIIGQMGGQKTTAYTTAGLGDLIATGFSSDSSNFQLGKQLAKNGKVTRVSEGVSVAKGLQQRLPSNFQSAKLGQEIIKVLDKIELT